MQQHEEKRIWKIDEEKRKIDWILSASSVLISAQSSRFTAKHCQNFAYSLFVKLNVKMFQNWSLNIPYDFKNFGK